MRIHLITFSVVVLLQLYWQSSIAEVARIDNELIVQLAPNVQIQEMASTITQPSSTRCLSKSMSIHLLHFENATEATAAINKLRIHKLVRRVQYNHRVEQRALIPNDTEFGNQWNMLNTGQSGGIAGADIDATDAWSINTDAVTAHGDSVVIAIIDERFDVQHEDINYFTNKNEVPSNGIDDDGNGYIDDFWGWNVFTASDDVISVGANARHSTHLSGIAAGKGDNGKGIAGVCWGAKILAITGSSETEADVIIAYDYVITMRRLYDNTSGAKGAYIVATNSSFGVDNGKPEDFPIWCALYDSMGTLGILSAGATANSNFNVDLVYDMPTSCPSPWLITVTNTTRFDTKPANAGYGVSSIDIGAPGQGIYSSLPDNTYGNMSGTSMAAPHVAGTIAAMFSAACSGLMDAYVIHPDSVALLIKKYILDGAEFNSSLNHLTVTSGRLNLFRAIKNLSNYNCDSCNFDLSIDKVDLRCRSVDDGAMAAVVSGDINSYTYNWVGGPSSIERLSMGPGFYTLVVTDTSGCRRSATAELHYPDTIIINNINVVPPDVTNGTITIQATAGIDTLRYSLNGSQYQQSPIFTIDTPGTYTIFIRNSTGCVVQQIVTTSSIYDTYHNPSVKIYPNPANSTLVILTPTPTNLSAEMYSYDGTLVLREEVANGTLSIEKLPQGIYLLRLFNHQNSSTIKISIQR